MPAEAPHNPVGPARYPSLEPNLRRLLGHQVAVDRVGGVDVGVAEPLGELADGPSRLQREGREGVAMRGAATGVEWARGRKVAGRQTSRTDNRTQVDT